MLVITRRPGEDIVIGEGRDAVTVTVLGVKGNQVRLGCNAPKTTPVDRGEIAERKQAERLAQHLNR